MNLKYPVIITRDENGAFCAEVPDLEGCFTFGDSLEEALAHARDAIAVWLMEYLEDGKVAPPTTPHDTPYLVEPSPYVLVPLLLRERREVLGLTQVAAAKALGVTYQTYQRFENPLKSNLTLKTLSKLMAFLGLDLVIVPSGSKDAA